VEAAVVIDPGLDYRGLRLDVALGRLDPLVWLPVNMDPLVLVRIWVHLEGDHTFDTLATPYDPDEACACRSTTCVGGELREEWSASGTVERMVQAVLALEPPPGLAGPDGAGRGRTTT
jgi:hypothetical protein